MNKLLKSQNCVKFRISQQHSKWVTTVIVKLVFKYLRNEHPGLNNQQELDVYHFSNLLRYNNIMYIKMLILEVSGWNT